MFRRLARRVLSRRGILVLSALALALPPTTASADTPRQTNPVSLCTMSNQSLCLQPGRAPLTVLGTYQNSNQFKWDRGADGSYSNRATRNGCLDLTRGTVATRIELCNQPTFRWNSNEWDPQKDGTIRNRHNNLCLSVNRGTVRAGNFTVVRRCEPGLSPDQKWVITSRA